VDGRAAFTSFVKQAETTGLYLAGRAGADRRESAAGHGSGSREPLVASKMKQPRCSAAVTRPGVWRSRPQSSSLSPCCCWRGVCALGLKGPAARSSGRPGVRAWLAAWLLVFVYGHAQTGARATTSWLAEAPLPRREGGLRAPQLQMTLGPVSDGRDGTKPAAAGDRQGPPPLYSRANCSRFSACGAGPDSTSSKNVPFDYNAHLAPAG